MNVLKWIARVLALVSLAFVLLFFFGEADFSQPVRLTVPEIVGLLFFPLGIIGGNLLGWWREGWGAAVSLGSLAAFYLADVVFTGTPPSGPFFALLALPGFLYAIRVFAVRRRAAQQASASG